MMMMRARFAEEQLLAAVGAGTRQYVILGAGLDSFAFRQPAETAGLAIYEIDHPDTQRWKRQRLCEAGLVVPANLHFVPADLNHDSLSAALVAAGFDCGAAGFFAWLGVTYYLPLASFLATLRFIRSSGPPAQVVFDFALQDAELPGRFMEFDAAMTQYLESAGEPWRLAWRPEALQEQLREMGFGNLVFSARRRRMRVTLPVGVMT